MNSLITFLFAANALALLNPNADVQREEHRLENLDRRESLTSLPLPTTTTAESVSAKPTFYTRSDGYLVRIMKAAPTNSKAAAAESKPQPTQAASNNSGNSNNNGNGNNKPNEGKKEDNDKPLQPVRPTVTMVKPSITELPPKTASNGKPIRTLPNTQPTGKKPNNSKDEDEENDGDDEEDPKKGSPKKKNPTEVPAPDAPVRTTTDAWGDYLLPTRSAKPRWMRNDAPHLNPLLSLALALSTLIILLIL